MNKTIILILSFILLSGSLRAAEKIIIAVDAPYPPFAYIEEKTGEVKGFDVDISNAICDYLKIECEVKVIEFNQIIEEMIAGKVDVSISGMGITPERSRDVIFGDKYYRSSSIFVAPVGSELTIDTLPEGSTISVQEKTMQEDYLRTTYKDKYKIKPMVSFFDILDAARTNKADLAFMDGLAGYYYLKADFGQDLDIVGEPVRLTDNAHIVLRKGLEPLRDDMSKALRKLKDNGTYDAINRKYFEFNIY